MGERLASSYLVLAWRRVDESVAVIHRLVVLLLLLRAADRTRVRARSGGSSDHRVLSRPVSVSGNVWTKRVWTIDGVAVLSGERIDGRGHPARKYE